MPAPSSVVHCPHCGEGRVKYEDDSLSPEGEGRFLSRGLY